MKILVIDSLFVLGHIHPNTHYINLLAMDHSVSVVSICGLFKELPGTINVVEIETPYQIKDFQKSRTTQIKFWKDLGKHIELGEYDAFVFLSYDIVTFAISRLFLPKDKIVVIQEHNNIDKLSSRYLYAILYKTFCNKVDHIVYESYMKEALVHDYGVKADRVFVLPRARFAYEKCTTDKSYSAIGLSRSNSDNYISKLIKEANEHAEEFADLKILLKVHDGFDDQSEIIETLTSRVSDQEYKELFNSTRIVLDPLPNTFKYRMSAVLFEALSSRKIVIGSDARIVKYFSEKYPHICYSADSPLEMLQLVKCVSSAETKEEHDEFEKFNYDYSDDKTKDVFAAILSTID